MPALLCFFNNDNKTAHHINLIDELNTGKIVLSEEGASQTIIRIGAISYDSTSHTLSTIIGTFYNGNTYNLDEYTITFYDDEHQCPKHIELAGSAT